MYLAQFAAFAVHLLVCICVQVILLHEWVARSVAAATATGRAVRNEIVRLDETGRHAPSVVVVKSAGQFDSFCFDYYGDTKTLC